MSTKLHWQRIRQARQSQRKLTVMVKECFLKDDSACEQLVSVADVNRDGWVTPRPSALST